MEYRQLGHDGPHITRLTFGAWPIGGGMGAVDEATTALNIFLDGVCREYVEAAA